MEEALPSRKGVRVAWWRVCAFAHTLRRHSCSLCQSCSLFPHLIEHAGFHGPEAGKVSLDALQCVQSQGEDARARAHEQQRWGWSAPAICGLVKRIDVGALAGLMICVRRRGRGEGRGPTGPRPSVGVFLLFLVWLLGVTRRLTLLPRTVGILHITHVAAKARGETKSAEGETRLGKSVRADDGLGP